MSKKRKLKCENLQRRSQGSRVLEVSGGIARLAALHHQR